MNKKVYVVGNWKLNKTIEQSLEWLNLVGPRLEKSDHALAIVCPSHLSLFPMREMIDKKNYPILLGAQDVSRYSAGKYTGEVSAIQLKGVVTHCIVGHSERQSYFHETVADIECKIEQLLDQDITPIICQADMAQFRQYNQNFLKGLIAFEPPSAISAGLGGQDKSLLPEDINKTCGDLVSLLPKGTPVLYGGSVTPQNAFSIFSQSNVGGGLIGGASLDPDQFVELFNAALRVVNV